jgi:hypothetical protein
VDREKWNFGNKGKKEEGRDVVNLHKATSQTLVILRIYNTKLICYNEYTKETKEE